jgi:hypothetical protein
VWLCRFTALHYALNNGHTETAMGLVKAGADVHCKDNDGYSSRAESSCPWVAAVQGGRSVHSGWRSRSACLGFAGSLHCN